MFQDNLVKTVKRHNYCYEKAFPLFKMLKARNPAVQKYYLNKDISFSNIDI